MRQVDVGYLAGLIDGEGTIYIVQARRYESKRRTRSSVYHQLTLQVYNNDVRIIQWLLDNCSGIVIRREPRKSAHSVSYTWTVTNQMAYDILKLTFPFLISKRDHACLAIEFFESKQTKKVSDRGFLTPSEIGKRDWYRNEIKKLNVKGPCGFRSKLGELREPETSSRRQSAAKPSKASEGSETTGDRQTDLNNQLERPTRK